MTGSEKRGHFAQSIDFLFSISDNNALNYLQNGTSTIVIALLVPEIHALAGDGERGLHFEKTLIKVSLPGKILDAPYTVCLIISSSKYSVRWHAQ